MTTCQLKAKRPLYSVAGRLARALSALALRQGNLPQNKMVVMLLGTYSRLSLFPVSVASYASRQFSHA